MSHIFQPKFFWRCGYDKDYMGYVFVTLVQVNTFPECEMSEFCSKMGRREDGCVCPIFDPKCSKWHVCTCSMEKKIGWSVFYLHARVFVGLGRKGTATVYLIKELKDCGFLPKVPHIASIFNIFWTKMSENTVFNRIQSKFFPACLFHTYVVEYLMYRFEKNTNMCVL